MASALSARIRGREVRPPRPGGQPYGDDCELWVIAHQFRRIPQGVDRSLTMTDDSIQYAFL
jgi:hypothetical protein